MFSAAQTDADVSNNLLAQLHKVLRPFMLRRLKSQVATDLPAKKEVLLYVGMSEMQARLYRGILEKDLDAVLGKTTQKSRLMNMVMQLRKVRQREEHGVTRVLDNWPGQERESARPSAPTQGELDRVLVV